MFKAWSKKENLFVFKIFFLVYCYSDILQDQINCLGMSQQPPKYFVMSFLFLLRSLGLNKYVYSIPE